MNFRAAIVFILLAIVSLAITLPWPEFSSGSENLVVSTAVESKRDRHWFIPTLNGEPRTKKPPLVTWIAAATIPSSTIARFDGIDREVAFDQTRWLTRWPLLIVLGTLLLTVWRIARRLWPDDPNMAIFSSIVVGSSYLLLRFERTVTTDVYLTLFVALAHLVFVETIFARKKLAWLAGVFVGLAFMCKGPVALVFTVLPWMVWMLLSRTTFKPSHGTQGEGVKYERGHYGMWISILISFALVGLPWFIYILTTTHGVLDTWQREVTREGATASAPDSPFIYLALPIFLAPWTVLFIVGLIDLIIHLKKRTDFRADFSLALLVIPILILTIPSDRKERYALPLIIPCALITSRALKLLADNFNRPKWSDRIVGTAHWILLGGMAIALGAIGTYFPKVAKTIDDQPWFSKQIGLSILALGILATVIGVVVSLKNKFGLAWSTGVIMLLVWIGLSYGYRNSREAKSEMRPLAQQIVNRLPDARLYQLKGTYAPSDLTLYANRIVENVDSIQSIPDGPHEEILIVKQRKREPIPAAPSGFETFTSVPRDDTTWWAFVRSR